MTVATRSHHPHQEAGEARPLSLPMGIQLLQMQNASEDGGG
ncbi:hypothetical protein ACFX2F_027055 [Malus domestica]